MNDHLLFNFLLLILLCYLISKLFIYKSHYDSLFYFNNDLWNNVLIVINIF